MAFPLIARASDICVGFDELATGTVYRVSQTFTSAAINCWIEPFQWSGGQWTSNGTARVQSGSSGFGHDPYLWLGNVNVRLDVGVATDIQLRFGAFGGNLNLRINGALTNFSSMRSLNGIRFGGADLIINSPVGGRGELRLLGIITDFAIGGQEFSIDDICISPYIGPKLRTISTGPSDLVTLTFSCPGTNASGLVLLYTGTLAQTPEWMPDPGATIASTAENWFQATTARVPGMNSAFYRVELNR